MRFARRNAIAFLALVLAMTGGAYAAGKIGSKRIKRDAVKARHIASAAIVPRHLSGDLAAALKGDPGATGPQGVRGARGPTGRRGRTGSRGPTGKTGATGARGPTGPYPAELPGASTLRGVWAVAGPSGSETAVSFSPALSTAPSQHLVAAGTPPDANCPGSADAPEAAAGHLCVYVEGNGAPVALFAPAAKSGRLGFGVRTTGAGRASGSWAVTAP